MSYIFRCIYKISIATTDYGSSLRFLIRRAVRSFQAFADNSKFWLFQQNRIISMTLLAISIIFEGCLRLSAHASVLALAYAKLEMSFRC